MEHIFLLSGDYIELAKEEVINLFDIGNSKLLDRLLIVDLKNNENELKKLSKRLALTKNIYKFLFKCNIDKLITSMKNFDCNSVYKDNFCLRIHNFNNNIKKFNNKNSIKNIKKYSEKNLAKFIWNSVTNPKVNLENPKTKIELFFIGDKVYCGLSIWNNKEDFKARKAHLRPFPNPSSLHPKIARVLVNISGVKENEILLDTFCGTGGFLIEAGLMKIKCIGCDISKNMVKGCKENLKYFKIRKQYKIINKNALDINKNFDYFITDLPYGLNSNVYLQYNKKSLKYKSNKINLKLSKKDAVKNLEQFYLLFLKNLRKKLKKKAVIIFPNYVDYKKLLKTSKFKIEKEFEIYVHRSLSRKIVRIG